MIKRLGEFWRQRRCMMEVDLWCLGDIGNSGLPSWEFIVGCWGPRNRTVETSVFASGKIVGPVVLILLCIHYLKN